MRVSEWNEWEGERERKVVCTPIITSLCDNPIVVLIYKTPAWSAEAGRDRGGEDILK